LPFPRGFLHSASFLLTFRSLAPRKARNPHYLSTSVAKAPYKPPTSHLQACYSGVTPARLRYLMGGPPVPVLSYRPPTSLIPVWGNNRHFPLTRPAATLSPSDGERAG